MTTSQFPTTAQLTMLCTWMTRGAEALDEPALYAKRKRARRNYSLRMIKGLTERLQLPDEYHAMRSRGVNGQPLTVTLDPLLRDEMYRMCRSFGYVLKDGSDLPPLNAYQMHVLHLLSWGYTYAAAGEVLGKSSGALSVTIGEAKRETGCTTVAGLVACAFRNEWLPTHKELRSLDPPLSRPLRRAS